MRPTVGGSSRTLEVHLFDFSDDLYDQEIEIRFVSHLRGEVKFPSVDSLRIQIQQDVNTAKQILTDFSST
jgi:riboflavin kinase/FMN adenylyltransferase